MASVEVSGDVRGLLTFDEQLTYAAALALTRTAKDSQDASIEAIKRTFTTRGTWYLPSSRFGIRITPATKARLEAAVGTAADWLIPHETGAVSLRIPYATGANADIIFVNACTGTFSTVTLKSMGANAGNASGVPLATGKSRHVRHDGESAYPAAPEQTTVGTPYAARVYNAADISVANATATALTFNSERRDDGSLHSTSVNTDRLTAQVSGWYLVFGNVEFVSNAVGFRTLSFRVNATPIFTARSRQGPSQAVRPSSARPASST